MKIASTPQKDKTHNVYYLITKHAKRQENMTHNAKTNQSIENNPELTQTLKLVEKDSKIQIKLPEMKTTMPEKYTGLEQWDIIHRQKVKI